MFKAISKPFAVMVLGLCTFTFLVTTATQIGVFAESSTSMIQINDNSTTSKISVCVDGSFVKLKDKKVTVSSGSKRIGLFYGDILGSAKCDDKSIIHQKVFDTTQIIKKDEIFEITVAGSAKLVGVINHNKTVLLSQSNISSIIDDSIISWKSITNNSVKNVSSVCVDNVILKEDKVGSRQARLSPGTYAFSFEYDEKDGFCSPVLPMSEGHTKVLNIGCEESVVYELSVSRDDDYSQAHYDGLTFATKLNSAIQTPPPIKKEIPVVKKPVTEIASVPVTPVVTPKVEEPKLKPIASTVVPKQPTTVRSGGGSEWMAIPVVLGFSGVGYASIRSRKLNTRKF